MSTLFTFVSCFAVIPPPPLPMTYLMPNVSVTAIVSGDFDRDGRIDLLAGSTKVGDPPVLLRRNDAGFFDEPTPATDNSHVNALVAADLDGDGDLDAVQQASQTLLGIAKNTGNGAFAYSTQPVTAAGALVAQDFDGDGDLDVAMSVYAQSSVVIFTNDGSSVFAVGASLPIPSPKNLAAGDLDNDGRVDMVTTSQASFVTLAHNLGGLAFSSTQSSPLSGNTAQVAVGDVTDDGLADLAVTFFGTDGMVSLTNLGGFTFATPHALGIAESRIGVAILDIDGDGIDDIASAGSGLVYFTGSAAGPANLHELLTQQPMNLAHAADVNGDGRPDFALGPTAIGRGIALVLTSPSGDYELPLKSVIPPASFGSKPLLADFDGDADLDVVYADGAGTIGVATNPGDATFQLGISVATGDPAGSTRRSVALGDLDNDGQLDVSYTPGTMLPSLPWQGNVWLALRTSGGGFQPPVPVVLNGIPEVTALADLDLDGIEDLVFGSHTPSFAFSSNDSLYAQRNLGPPSYTQFAPYFNTNLGSGPNQATSEIQLVTADFTNDGLADIGAASRLSGDVRALRNLGNGSFATLVSTGASSPSQLAVGHLNADNFIDLALSSDPFGSNSDYVVGFLGGVTVMDLATGGSQVGLQGPTDMALGDLDGNGQLDFVTTRIIEDSGIDVVTPGVQFNWPRRSVLTDGYLSTVACGDLDGDGRTDVLSTSPFQPNTLSVHRNLAGDHPWTVLGYGKPGHLGAPRLLAQGTLMAGSTGAVLLKDAQPNTLAVIVVAAQSLPIGVLGGTLAAYPALFTVSFMTDAHGELTIPWTQFSPASPGQNFWLQFLVADPTASKGVAFSNAVKATQP